MRSEIYAPVQIVTALLLALNITTNAQTASDTTHILIPGQLFIRGVDNHASNGTAMVINISTTVDLEKGSVFTLSDSEYTGTNGQNKWEHISGGVSGISIKYTGQATIDRGSSICIVIPYTQTGSTQSVQSIEINGSTSTNFSYTGVGKANSSSVIPAIKLNKSGFDHLYLMQSGWHEASGEFQMPGTVIDGFVSVPNGTNESTVVIPPNLTGRDIVHQTPSNFYAFVICNDLLYFCNLIELLDGNGNWTVSTGSSGNDLDSEGICERVCNVSECNGGLETKEIPLDYVCDYSICYGGFSFDGAIVISDIEVDGISLDGEAGFDFPYCWISEYSQGNWICDYTGENGCPGNLPCATELIDDLGNWLTLNDYVFEDIFIEWDRGLWCLMIVQTDADFEIAYFGYEAFDIQLAETIYYPDGTAEEYIYDTIDLGELNLSINIIESNCTYGLYKIVAVPHACEDPEFDWSVGSHYDHVTVQDGTLYSVTVSCDDSCSYEASGYVDPHRFLVEK
jgi:hypothetical protein